MARMTKKELHRWIRSLLSRKDPIHCFGSLPEKEHKRWRKAMRKAREEMKCSKSQG